VQQIILRGGIWFNQAIILTLLTILTVAETNMQNIKWLKMGLVEITQLSLEIQLNPNVLILKIPCQLGQLHIQETGVWPEQLDKLNKQIKILIPKIRKSKLIGNLLRVTTSDKQILGEHR
jgi:hypothetical protein